MSDKNAAPAFRWTFPFTHPNGPLKARWAKFVASIDWPALLRCASAKRDGVQCRLLPDIGGGFNHMVRVIEFEDGIRWVARLRKPPLDGGPYPPDTATAMGCELNAALLARQRARVPTPRVHAVETSEKCNVGAPFVLMNCLDGNAGVDLGMQVPRCHKHAFYRKMAEIQVALATVQLPRIGTILSIASDGTCTQGPIPGIGGPFDTAAAFFRAWADEQLRAAACRSTPEAMPAVASFPQSIYELADRLSICNNGPFPLCHGDFGHNNIVVSDEYEVLGVIDWESAYAAPWEIAGSFPLTLSTVPQVADDSSLWNCDGISQLENAALTEELADQVEYVQLVREEEERRGLVGDPCLSQALADRKRQDVVTAMRLFRAGQTGSYSRIVEQFDPR